MWILFGGPAARAVVRSVTGARVVLLCGVAGAAPFWAPVGALAQADPGDTVTVQGDSAPLFIESDLSDPALAAEGRAGVGGGESVVSYSPEYFAPYSPANALDMVNRVPGFSTTEGGNARGFAQNAANVLIDGNRPSAKSQDVSDILARIPVSDVSRIDLIRGQVAGVDMGGQAVVVNVVRRVSDRSGGVWRAELVYNTWRDAARPAGELNYNTRALGADVSLGLSVRQTPTGGRRMELISDAAGALLQRNAQTQKGSPPLAWTATMSAQRPVGDWILRLNGRYAESGSGSAQTSYRAQGLQRPRITTPGDIATVLRRDAEFTTYDYDEFSWEVGGDLERQFSDTLSLKLIGVKNYLEGEGLHVFAAYDPAGLVSASYGDEYADSGETILRGFLTWTPNAQHSFELGAEGAYNYLNAVFSTAVDTGAGPVDVPVAGGRAKVEELRAEPYVSWLWRPRAGLSFDARLAAEISRIEQSGDSSKTREFFYPKGQFTATWDVAAQTQLRASLERSVGQLQFFDFVTFVDFGQGVTTTANPELVPPQTWTLRGELERRFWDDAVASLTLSHEWIDDAYGTVPLPTGGEGPGSMGDATRWSVRGALDLPLARLGIAGGRLQTSYQYGESELTDPVTGQKRVLNSSTYFGGGNGPRTFNISYRHDYAQAGWSWGASYTDTSSNRNYRLTQITAMHQLGTGIEAFVETTRFFGVNMRLALTNLGGDPRSDQYRYIFAGPRNAAPLQAVEYRSTESSTQVTLQVRGSF